MSIFRFFQTSHDKEFHGLDDLKQVTQMKTTKTRVQCYCLSDLHADSDKSLTWVEKNCRPANKDTIFSVFIIPGDIGSKVENIGQVFRHLTSHYDAVCYVPGNHEAWTIGSNSRKKEGGDFLPAEDSVKKLIEINKIAKEIGVVIGPLAIEYDGRALFLFPMWSWYHSSFDTEPDIQHPLYLQAEKSIPFEEKWGDFRMCKWPENVISKEEYGHISSKSDADRKIAEAFGQLNEHFLPKTKDVSFSSPIIEEFYRSRPELEPERHSIISFSHFVPRQELTPEKRFLIEPQLSKVIGSDVLESQLRRLRPNLHLFGHTHIPIDMELEDIRYIQWPLGYSREADKQCAPIFQSGPLCAFDSVYGDGKEGIPSKLESQNTHWTNYYRDHTRDPNDVMNLAPWVIKRMEMFIL